jgi:hypothetical protein
MGARHFAVALALVLAPAIAGAGVGRDADPPKADAASHLPRAFGVYASFGMAHTFADFPEETPFGWKPRFAGGGGAYVDLYMARHWAIEIALGLVGKGARHGTTGSGMRRRILCLEVPIGVALDIRGVRAGVALAFTAALHGIDAEIVDGHVASDESQPWGVNEAMNEWDHYRRLNLCPQISLGYAIPVGKLAIVPKIAWSIEIIDTVKGDAEGLWAEKSRNMNLMVNLDLEYGSAPSPAAN